MKTAAIIPALNEEESIAHVIAGVPGDLAPDVIVVDNGSVDGTGEAARAAGARVVREERRGYGYACAAGAAAAGDEIDVLVFLDGDGSPDLLIVDFHMPGIEGRSFIRQLADKSSAPILLITGEITEELEKVSGMPGIVDVVRKPLDIERFLEIVQVAVQN